MRILMALFFLISLSHWSFGQVDTSQTFPRYVVENGDTIGILFSVEQVQKIDTKLEILEELEDISVYVDSLDAYYVSLVNDLESKTATLIDKVDNLEEQIRIKDDLISNLQSQISNKNSIITNRESVIENKDLIISEKDKEIKKQKFLKKIGFVGTVVGGIIIVVLSVAAN